MFNHSPKFRPKQLHNVAQINIVTVMYLKKTFYTYILICFLKHVKAQSLSVAADEALKLSLNELYDVSNHYVTYQLKLHHAFASHSFYGM